MSHLRLVDADSDLATIRLRTVSGQLYDIDVEWITGTFKRDEFRSPMTTQITLVPTWEGVPIPNDIEPDREGLNIGWWKRGVTDANSAGDAEVVA